MKKSLIMLAALVATSAMATGYKPPQQAAVTVSGSGSNTVMSSTAAGSYVNGIGTSVSKASNVQGATSYVGGSGNFSSTPTNAYVTLDDCKQVKVPGMQSVGSVLSFGGTTAWGESTASNISTGTGTGGAQAVGFSLAEVEGKTVLTSPKMNLEAGGSAFSAVGTNTGVIGTNGSGFSAGSVASSFKATQTGSLFTYSTPNLSGDVKEITSNSYTNVGGIPTAVGSCGGTKCVSGPSVVVNADVEGGANAYTNGQINYTFSK